MWQLTGLPSSQLRIVLKVVYPVLAFSVPGDFRMCVYYMRLAACSMLTTLAMSCSLSFGTFSQMLNASINFPRISLPGFAVM